MALSILCGCVSTNNTSNTSNVALREKLITQKDLFLTLEAYDKNYGASYRNLPNSQCSFNNKRQYDRITEIVKSVAPLSNNPDAYCFFYSYSEEYGSDKCILLRRQTKAPEVCFFDYRSFLPDDIKINNDAEFWELYVYYTNYNFDGDCPYMKIETTAEKEACKIIKRQEFIDAVHSKYGKK